MTEDQLVRALEIAFQAEADRSRVGPYVQNLRENDLWILDGHFNLRRVARSILATLASDE